MPYDEQTSSTRADTATARSRHPHQEIADLLAAALLRLRARNAPDAGRADPAAGDPDGYGP